MESLPLYREVVEWLPEWRSVYDSDHIYFRDGDPYPFYAGRRFFVATSTYDWFARRYTVLPTGVIVRADFRSRVTRVEHPDEASVRSRLRIPLSTPLTACDQAKSGKASGILGLDLPLARLLSA